MVSLDALVVTTALPTIRRELHASLRDRYGRRRMFSFGVTLFGAGSVGCALASSAGLLVVARAVRGAGAAFVIPLALALLTGAFAPCERGAGLRLMPWGAVTIVVPALAGRLINRYGERPFVVAGMTLHAFAFAWIALTARAGLPYWELVPPLVLSGTGSAMV